MLLAVLDETALPLSRRALAIPLERLIARFLGRRLMQLLDEARMRPGTVLPLGVRWLRIAAFAHGEVSLVVREVLGVLKVLRVLRVRTAVAS
ncbi:MAG: hypothetical protein ACT4PJ_08590 [Gemmatimonadaceae bacterium]